MRREPQHASATAIKDAGQDTAIRRVCRCRIQGQGQGDGVRRFIYWRRACSSRIKVAQDRLSQPDPDVPAGTRVPLFAC